MATTIAWKSGDLNHQASSEPRTSKAKKTLELCGLRVLGELFPNGSCTGSGLPCDADIQLKRVLTTLWRAASP
jgi:hypothetical protein